MSLYYSDDLVTLHLGRRAIGVEVIAGRLAQGVLVFEEDR